MRTTVARTWIRNNVTGLIAIFIALGGVAAAASTAPKNSVTSRSIRNGQVKGRDIRDGQVGTRDLADGAVTGAKLAPGVGDPSGPAGGDLTGAYPDPAIADGAVTPSKFGEIPTARVFNSGNESVPNNSLVELNFDSERWDVGGMHSSTTDSEPLTAPVAGVYEITGAIDWGSSSTGARYLDVQLNGTTEIVSDFRQATTSGGGDTSQTVTTQWRLAVGDEVRLRAYQNSGSALNVLTNPAFSPEFAMTWLAPG